MTAKWMEMDEVEVMVEVVTPVPEATWHTMETVEVQVAPMIKPMGWQDLWSGTVLVNTLTNPNKWQVLDTIIVEVN